MAGKEEEEEREEEEEFHKVIAGRNTWEMCTSPGRVKPTGYGIPSDLYVVVETIKVHHPSKNFSHSLKKTSCFSLLMVLCVEFSPG